MRRKARDKQKRRLFITYNQVRVHVYWKERITKRQLPVMETQCCLEGCHMGNTVGIVVMLVVSRRIEGLTACAKE